VPDAGAGIDRKDAGAAEKQARAVGMVCVRRLLEGRADCRVRLLLRVQVETGARVCATSSARLPSRENQTSPYLSGPPSSRNCSSSCRNSPVGSRGNSGPTSARRRTEQVELALQRRAQARDAEELRRDRPAEQIAIAQQEFTVVAQPVARTVGQVGKTRIVLQPGGQPRLTAASRSCGASSMPIRISRDTTPSLSSSTRICCAGVGSVAERQRDRC
jgi:hypothetical protein